MSLAHVDASSPYSQRTGRQENDMPDKFTQPRLDVTKLSPDLYKSMAGLQNYVDASGLERKLLDLVKIRASQINGCAYCIVMHTNDARKRGEIDEWMHLLNAWREAPVFSARERAALALTEAVTKISEHRVPDEVYDEARRHFSEKELVDLTAAVIAINAWNRAAITFRATPRLTTAKLAA
jgi:AhpD family alkylhydroperoxidase